MNERWLKCRVYKGVFSDELVVSVSPKRTHRRSYFVPKDQVQGNAPAEGEEGKLRVKVFQRDDTTWAVLPTEYQETIAVRDEDLLPA